MFLESTADLQLVSVECIYTQSSDVHDTLLVYEVRVKFQVNSQVNEVKTCIHRSYDSRCLHFPFSNDWVKFAQSCTPIAQHNCCVVNAYDIIS